MSVPARSHGGGVETRVSELERKQKEGPFGDPATVRATLDVYSKAESAALFASGSIVKSTYAEYLTYSGAISAVIPQDDTIPQISEGAMALSASITPSATTSKVRGRVTGVISSNSAANGLVAVFRNSVASAIASQLITVPGTSYLIGFCLDFQDSPATTSAVSYSVRIGPGGANVVYLNGNTGRLLGGSQRTALTLEEIKA